MSNAEKASPFTLNTNHSRRRFLLGMVAAPAVILTPGLLMPVRSQVLTLYGTGFHDDTDALQALLDGKKVFYRGSILAAQGGVIVLPSAPYSISKGLSVNASRSISMSNSTFGPTKPIPYFFSVKEGAEVTMSNITLMQPPA